MNKKDFLKLFCYFIQRNEKDTDELFHFPRFYKLNALDFKQL